MFWGNLYLIIELFSKLKLVFNICFIESICNLYRFIKLGFKARHMRNTYLVYVLPVTVLTFAICSLDDDDDDNDACLPNFFQHHDPSYRSGWHAKELRRRL